MAIQADRAMRTDIRRFLLLSAAIHLVLLAALTHHGVAPQLLPSTLTVTLSEPPALTGATSNRDITPDSPMLTKVHTAGDAAKPHHASNPTKHAAPDMSSPGIATSPKHHDVIIHSEKPDSAPADALPSNIVSQVIGHPSYDSIMETQALDAAILTTQLQEQLRNALVAYFAYPMLARRNGWQGEVWIGLRVEADGRLSHIRLTQSSGYRLLDNAALTSLNHVNALPDAAGWLQGRYFDMVLPIEYRLIDG